MDTTVLFAKILDSACSSYGRVDGYSEYRIETHCVTWYVIARCADGVWQIKNYTTD